MNLWSSTRSRLPISCCTAGVRWRTLYGYLQGNDKAIEALRRIVQAELMGQFYTLKYFTDDLQREIRYPISEAQETTWKHNLTLERGRSSQKKQMILPYDAVGRAAP